MEFIYWYLAIGALLGVAAVVYVLYGLLCGDICLNSEEARLFEKDFKDDREMRIILEGEYSRRLFWMVTMVMITFLWPAILVLILINILTMRKD